MTSPGAQFSDRIPAVVRFAYEAGHLARTPRTGMQLAAVGTPDSVAEHSFRVGVLAYLIAHEEGCDPDHAATLGLFHDIAEARTGDLNSVTKRYVSAVDLKTIVSDQVEGLPPALATHIIGLIGEFEGAKEENCTPEADCARDADKLECLLVAREYAASGFSRLQPWIDTMAAVVRTSTARELAHGAQDVGPSEWWYRTVSSYGLTSGQQ